MGNIILELELDSEHWICNDKMEIHIKICTEFASIQIYGITQDLETHLYVNALEYVSDRNPREYLKNNF
ncbi:hypothetical protein Glove_228g66 [Diversispora epigaea]|uniref:Uncharacterized protein n=1 Tax=Diversispora epigaea TaxID=1348612 RepID=A0A397ILM7_9GLOM|nr:hypothetical protein Glove_228g66 [Diversispora epigaea]